MRLYGRAPGWAVGIVVAALGVTAVAAQEPSGIRVGWHVVRPGETLYEVAAQYLGSSEEWRLLAELNPEVSDPDVISPGQRIRVRVLDTAAPDTAQLNKVSRRVEEQLRPLEWSPATEENFLNNRDGVRTFESSSAELIFADRSRLLVSEDTLVFLGRSGEVEQTVRREEIEIVVGQADLEGSEGADSYNLRVGGSVLRPQAGPEGRSQARARRPESGGAELMVYEGESSVASGGATQQVARGMGTKVEEGKPPAPPEKLLPAAELIAPEEASASPIANPTFSWKPVDGAAEYVLEICLDRDCARLFARHSGLVESEVKFDPITAGDYFWRVTAVAPSGLDGYPSSGNAFSVDDAIDENPPTIATSLEGRRYEGEGTLFLGADGRLAVTVEDAETGVGSVTAIVDGAEATLDEAAGPWSAGPHEVVIVATDVAGNEARSETLSFVYDPDPPVLVWGPTEGVEYRRFTGENRQFDDGPSSRKRGWRLRELMWHAGDAHWKLSGDFEWSIGGSTTPDVTLRTDRRKQRLYSDASSYLQLTRDGGTVIETSDDLSGTTELKFKVETDESDPRRRRTLTVISEDRVGNRTSVVFELWRGTGLEPR